MCHRDQIGEFLRAYREDGDSDDARFSRRVDAAINALVKPWQFLDPDPAADYLFTVSPVIVPLVGVDEMHRLEAAFRQAAEAPRNRLSSADDFAPPRRRRRHRTKQGADCDAQSRPSSIRIEQVQVLNWGGYCGLQVMQAGRSQHGHPRAFRSGKSTLLDAMASVIMPNPQEFNQAARDDKGRKRERTVYTYARGLTVNHQDDNGRSATPSYLRPPGDDGFHQRRGYHLVHRHRQAGDRFPAGLGCLRCHRQRLDRQQHRVRVRA